MPKDDFLLKDLEFLGWIKTQALEINHMSPTDVTTQAKLMADHPELGSSCICITASFTPGSVSLSGHSLTPGGFEWGRKNADNSSNPPVRYCSCVLGNFTANVPAYRASTPTCQRGFNCSYLIVS